MSAARTLSSELVVLILIQNVRGVRELIINLLYLLWKWYTADFCVQPVVSHKARIANKIPQNVNGANLYITKELTRNYDKTKGVK